MIILIVYHGLRLLVFLLLGLGHSVKFDLEGFEHELVDQILGDHRHVLLDVVELWSSALVYLIGRMGSAINPFIAHHGLVG